MSAGAEGTLEQRLSICARWSAVGVAHVRSGMDEVLLGREGAGVRRDTCSSDPKRTASGASLCAVGRGAGSLHLPRVEWRRGALAA